MQKEHFFHELCHILRHAERQRMARSISEVQEWVARYFPCYATLPLHLITKYNFKGIMDCGLAI
ncbi:hypothetical protein [Brevibacillus migulae]|uniref:hypothetical protein n=1 Tax=Brevibacillus migulae TaxID=1644114 RepID=UPI002E26B8BC